MHGFSIKGRLKIFHQDLLKKFSSGFDGKIKNKVRLIRIDFSIAIVIAIEIFMLAGHELVVTKLANFN